MTRVVAGAAACAHGLRFLSGSKNGVFTTVAGTLRRSNSTVCSICSTVPGAACSASTEVERDVLLEDRRPGVAGHLAHLAAVLVVDRQPVAARGRRQAGRQREALVERLERLPGHLEADQRPRRAALLLGLERLAADEVGEARALEVDDPAEADLEGRRLARLEHHLGRAEVVDAEQDEAGLDARDVERVEPGRRDAVRPAGVHQRVPQPQRARPSPPTPRSRGRRCSRCG